MINNINKTCVLLVNLGTPKSPKTSDVRKYLFQFLNDKRVIDLPWIIRKILVNLIIVPFRAPKSAKVYKEVWTKDGSPIIYHTKNLTKKLNKSLGDNFHVEYAMRYKNPSIKNALEKIKYKKPRQIIIIPLFPQYASATNGSVIEEVMKNSEGSGTSKVKIKKSKTMYLQPFELHAWHLRETGSDAARI